MIRTICICGGGSLGHVIAGVLSNQKTRPLAVNILTNRPTKWTNKLIVNTPDGNRIEGNLTRISSYPEDVIPQSDVILICLPGPYIQKELIKIKDFLTPGSYVGCVFSSTGFFFEAMKILPENIKLWGFQRVPFIARTLSYGHYANLLGYKKEYKIAVERASELEKEAFRIFIEDTFGATTILLANYLEASITNSNPLLHTSRLYTMFKDWKPGIKYNRDFLFYEEWNNDAADLYIKMDNELASLIKILPVTPGFLPTVLEYYECNDVTSLAKKLRSIESFKGIKSPMIEISKGEWIPDFSSRYFTEDFGCGLKYIRDLCAQYNIAALNIEAVYNWGISLIANDTLPRTN